MKKLLFIVCLFQVVSSTAQPPPSKRVGATDYSYSKMGNDYTFYLHSYFSFGSGGGPNISGFLTQKSNDTLYIKALYNTAGIWAAWYGVSYDTIKYTKTDSDIHYINVSSNSYAYDADSGFPSTDTSWYDDDSTFVLSTAGIATVHPVSVNIYPNPTTHFIMLPNTALSQELYIYNSLGQQVLHQYKILATEIGIGNLPAGIYFITLYDNNKNRTATGKFCKIE